MGYLTNFDTLHAIRRNSVAVESGKGDISSDKQAAQRLTFLHQLHPQISPVTIIPLETDFRSETCPRVMYIYIYITYIHMYVIAETRTNYAKYRHS